jgi:hydroxymethylglutaryl-CoA lyase
MLMAEDSGSSAEIVEMAPRDGFQPIPPFIATSLKTDFVRLSLAGNRLIS